MFNSKPLSSLTNDELSSALKSLNLNVGPIISSTRKIYENRLKEHLLKTNESYQSNEKPNKYVASSLEECNSQTNIESNNDFVKKLDINDTGNSNGDSNPQNFYAVWTPFSSKTENGIKVPNIYTTQKNALAFMKENRGSRFKLFKSIEEAENFSLSKLDKPNVEKVLSSSIVNNADSKVIFKSPTFHELLKFKKYIEEGNFAEIQKCLCNPRYLITSLDMPVILQEGCRYNPMHVAVHSNKVNICKYFIELLHSHRFLKLVFSDDSDDIDFREKQLVDIFLNTPDKACCDTPLHTACKFCFKEIVTFLLKCKQIDLKSVNKDGLTAFQVIGQRVNNQSLKHDIEELFEEKAYIPLYKNDLNPCVGKPIITLSPMDEDFSAETIKAYVGPVTPAKAILVFTIWKTQRKSPVALSDIDKGLERLGRDIADKENVPFTEYWSFLNGFYNLVTKKGLEKLEEYLNLKSENSINLYETSSYELSTSENILEKNETNLKDDIKRKLFFEDETLDKHFETNFDSLYNEPLEHNDCSIDLDFKDLSALFKTCSKRNKESNTGFNENEINQDKILSPVQRPIHSLNNNIKKKKKSQKIFIDGDTPTKVDLDVFRAIKDVVIEPLQYPSIHHWRTYIESYSDTSKLSWPSPGSPRYHKYKKKTALPNVEDTNNDF